MLPTMFHVKRSLVCADVLIYDRVLNFYLVSMDRPQVFMHPDNTESYSS